MNKKLTQPQIEILTLIYIWNGKFHAGILNSRAARILSRLDSYTTASNDGGKTRLTLNETGMEALKKAHKELPKQMNWGKSWKPLA